MALLAVWAIVLSLGCALARPGLSEAAPPAIDASVLEQPGDRLFPQGKAVYQQYCAGCHDQGVGRAPQLTLLRYMSPEAIHRALTTGMMREQGSALTSQQRVDVAQFLSSRKLEEAGAAPPLAMCRGRAAVFDHSQPPAFTNWGLDLAGTHSISQKSCRADPRQSRPAASSSGASVSPAASGCARSRRWPAARSSSAAITARSMRWTADRLRALEVRRHGEVRTGIVVAPWRAGDPPAKPLPYFGDVVRQRLCGRRLHR